MKSLVESECGIHAESLHHTHNSSEKDHDVILKQLLESRIFDYIPALKTQGLIRISDCVSVDRLVDWIKDHERRLANILFIESRAM